MMRTMDLQRRRLLTLSPFIALRAPTARAALQAGPPALRIADGSATLRLEPDGPAVAVPADEARIAAALALGGRQVVAVAFRAALFMGSRAELAALVGVDGAHPRILGVELLNWRSPSGAILATHLSATPDGTRIRLERVGTRPRPDLPPAHESWIDYLRLEEGTPLADAPVHAVVPGTCQSALAFTRTRVAAALAAPCDRIDHAWLDGAGLLAPPF
jgi:hypothetical protein